MARRMGWRFVNALFYSLRCHSISHHVIPSVAEESRPPPYSPTATVKLYPAGSRVPAATGVTATIIRRSPA